MSEPTYAELKAKLAAMEAKLAAKRTITLKIGEKGGLSLYGLGRFPVTLYKSQWLALLNEADKIKAFLEAHASELKEKPE